MPELTPLAIVSFTRTGDTELKHLSEVGKIKSGLSLSRHKPTELDARGKSIKVYRTSHCKPTDTGVPPEPDDYRVIDSFYQPQQVLEEGDILISKRFTYPGCVVFESHSEPCYADGSVAVIRPHDRYEGQFVADYLNSAEGKQALVNASKPTPYDKLRCLSIPDIKALEIPALSVEEMRNFSLRVATQRLKSIEVSRQSLGVDVSKVMSNVQTFMSEAIEKGLVKSIGGVTLVTNGDYTLTVSKHGLYQVENLNTKGFMVFKSGDLIASENISTSDLQKLSGNHLRELTKQEQFLTGLENFSISNEAKDAYIRTSLSMIEKLKKESESQANLIKQQKKKLAVSEAKIESILLEKNIRNSELSDGELVVLARKVLSFLKVAEAAGLVASINDSKVSIGREYKLFLSEKNGILLVESKMTKGSLIYKDNEIFFSEKMTKNDIEKFNDLLKVYSNEQGPRLSQLEV